MWSIRLGVRFKTYTRTVTRKKRNLLLMKWSLTFGLMVLMGTTSGQDLVVAAGTWDAQGEPHPALRILFMGEEFGPNAIIDLPENTAIPSSISNLDSVDHHLLIQDVAWEGINIPAGASVDFEWPALDMGSYRYHLIGDRGQYLQASGVVRVGIDSDHKFVWHLADAQAAWMDSVALGIPLDLMSYAPDYFTINEAHFPYTLEDSLALIELQLGDTAVISVANSGQMDHVLHFHGFHVQVLHSSRSPERLGWMKDSMPIRKGEGLTLELVVDQIGTYPVHDHNLIAVTNAGFYPGGMLTQIIVTP